MHQEIDMKEQGPAIFSFIGVMFFLGMWVIYLFSAQPEGQLLSNVAEQLKYSFDTSAEHFNYFALTVFTCFLCVVCTILFWLKKKTKLAMAIVGINTMLALAFYSWSTAIIIAGPLLFFKQVIKMHNKVNSHG